MNMDLPPLPALYPALRLLMIKKIRRAIDEAQSKHIGLLKPGLQDDCLSSTVGSLSAQPATLSSEIIPLNRAKDLTQIVYCSAIALSLSKQWRLPIVDLAHQIVGCLTIEDAPQELGYSLLEESWKHINAQVLPPGWIVLTLSDYGVALWLQMLATQSFCLERATQRNDSTNFKNDNPCYQDSTSLFEIQYAHARCCSVLTTAMQAGLITSSDFRAANLNTDTGELDLFPWLAEDSLRLQNHAEKHLIGQIFVTLDELSTASLAAKSSIGRFQFALKIAKALGQRVLAFHAACRIFGEVRVSHPQLVQARLGLMLISRSLLRSILQDRLGVVAPTEL